MDTDKQKQIAQFFNKEPVVAVYLFGSQATGKAGPMSDVDIAIMTVINPWG